MWVRHKKYAPINMNFIATFEVDKKNLAFKNSEGKIITEWIFANENQANEASTILMNKIKVFKI